MNKKDFWYLPKTERPHKYYDLAVQKLKEWKTANGITVRCCIHHIDDVESAITFNEQFYERWGFNENNEFIEGQYVKFMTLSEHSSYHATHRSKETCDKISNSLKGHKTSDGTRQKLSESHKGLQTWCKGKSLTDAHKQAISDGNAHYWKGKQFSSEHRQHISETRKGRKMTDEAKCKSSESHKQRMIAIKALYAEHKNNGGTLSWNEFQRYLKEVTNDCTNNAS